MIHGRAFMGVLKALGGALNKTIFWPFRWMDRHLWARAIFDAFLVAWLLADPVWFGWRIPDVAAGLWIAWLLLPWVERGMRKRGWLPKREPPPVKLVSIRYQFVPDATCTVEENVARCLDELEGAFQRAGVELEDQTREAWIEAVRVNLGAPLVLWKHVDPEAPWI